MKDTTIQIGCLLTVVATLITTAVVVQRRTNATLATLRNKQRGATLKTETTAQ